MTTYQITSKAGADYGEWTADTAAEALAAMHRDAGYDDVTALGDEVVFPDSETEEMCGGLDAWLVREVR